MPWCCGQCSRWNLSKQKVCPQCGRAAKGRVCRRCGERAPKDAMYCVQCGSDRLTEKAVRRYPFTWRTRVALVLGAGLTLGLIFLLLQPALLALGRWLGGLVCRVAWAAFLFWLVTGLLPHKIGRALRRGVGALFRFTWLLVRALLP